MLIGLHVQIHAQYGERGRLEIDQLFEQLCGSGFTGERILGVDWFSGSRHGFGQLTRLLQHAECQTGTQLTKSAPLGGDSETRTLKGPGEATWASRRAALAKLERAAFPQHWPFPASPCRRAVNQKDKEFVAGAIFSGMAMVLTLMIVARTVMNLQNYITVRHVEVMCKLILLNGSIVALAY